MVPPINSFTSHPPLRTPILKDIYHLDLTCGRDPQIFFYFFVLPSLSLSLGLGSAVWCPGQRTSQDGRRQRKEGGEEAEEGEGERPAKKTGFLRRRDRFDGRIRRQADL